MLQHFKDWWNYRGTKKEMRRLSKQFEADDKKYRAAGESPNDRQQRHGYEQSELNIYWESIGRYKTERLCRKAARFDVQLPNRSDGKSWEECSDIGGHNLSYAGEFSLRKAIREEARTRNSHAVTVASLLLGLIGTLTGLVLGLKELGFRF